MKKLIMVFFVIFQTYFVFSQIETPSKILTGNILHIQKASDGSLIVLDSIKGIVEYSNNFKRSNLISRFDSTIKFRYIIGMSIVNQNIIIATYQQGVYIVNKKYPNWKKVEIPITYYGKPVDVNGIVSLRNKLFLITEKGICTSVDAGENWKKIKSFTPADSSDAKLTAKLNEPDVSNNAFCDIRVVDGNLYTSTGRGKIYFSKDLGLNWSFFYEFPTFIYGITAMENRNELYFKGTFCSIQKYNFATRKFTRIALPNDLKLNGYILDKLDTMLILYRNDGRVYNINEKDSSAFEIVSTNWTGLTYRIVIIDNEKYYCNSSGLYRRED